ncbi:MAG: response regulator [Polyangiaceae bacterium]|nr:response regulator [Polyangiaceae bacterium]
MAVILLVEDNEMNRDMLARRLERRGYSMLVAIDGEAGVTLARERRPDLILMDVSLPGIDGLEATRRLRRDALTSSIPIIALTAHAMAGDDERCREAGADDYDTKPVDLARLLSKMEALLAKRPNAGG